MVKAKISTALLLLMEDDIVYFHRKQHLYKYMMFYKYDKFGSKLKKNQYHKEHSFQSSFNKAFHFSMHVL